MSDSRQGVKPRDGRGDPGAPAGPSASGAPEAAAKQRYRELFERFAPGVRGYFARRGVHRDACDALTEEVLVALWERVDAHGGECADAPLAGWAFAIARNKYIDGFCARKRPEPDPHDPCFVPAPENAAQPSTGGAARTRALAGALEGLSDAHREILQSLYCDGLSMAELATAMDLPLATVQSRARHALQLLRAQLGEKRS